MTEVDRREDLLSIINKMERRLAKVERVTKYDDENDLPPLPPDVDLSFRVKEFRSRADYKAHVKWTTTSPNTCQADVDYWIVELQATNAAGVPRDELSDSDATPFTYRSNVNNKEDVDTPHAVFDTIPHPSTWYYRARVRIVDKAHRKGPWSDWVGPFQPSDVALPKAPVPTGVAIDYSRIDNDRWDRKQAEVIWDEIGEWDIPGDRSVTVTNATAASNVATYTTGQPHYLKVGDKVEVKNVQPVAYNETKHVTDVVSPTVFKVNLGSTPANLTNAGIAKLIVDNLPDVAFYEVKFRRCTAGGVAIGGTRRRTIRAKDGDSDLTASVTFEKGVKKASYYQAAVRSIARFAGMKSDWSAWTTPSTPSDANPPPHPKGVEAFGTIRHVGIEWDQDTSGDDGDIMDEAVAYSQVHVAFDKNFSNIFRRDRYVARTDRQWETERYKQRFWLRVRNVDSSGNKSAWVVAGPVRPVPPGAKRVTAKGSVDRERLDNVTQQNEARVPLSASPGNAAKLVSTASQDAIATIDGEASDGTLEAVLHTGGVADRIYIGMTFRKQDANDFLFVALVDIVGTNALILGRCNAGVFSTLASYTGRVIKKETTYRIRVEMSGSTVQVYMADVLRITHTTSAYQTETDCGVLMRRNTTMDNGQSRWGSWRFTPYTITIEVPEEITEGTPLWDDARFEWDDPDMVWDGPLSGVSGGGGTTITVTNTVPSIDDDFERAGRSTDLGEAGSGQTYTVDAGTFGIEETRVPEAYLGTAIILPSFKMERFEETELNAPSTGLRYVGADGIDLGSKLLAFDRPTYLQMSMVSTIGNRSTSNDFNIRVFIVAVVDGVETRGRASYQHMPVDGDPATKWHNVTVFRDYLIDYASEDTPVTVEFWAGFQGGGGLGRQITLRDFKLRVLYSYAPDLGAGFDPAMRPAWTTQGETREAYRVLEGEDADATG